MEHITLPAAQNRIATSLRGTKPFTLLADRQKALPKFSKWNAYYVHQAKKASLSCATCPWYNQNNTCTLVDTTGSPDDGLIQPTGTCALWNAGPARIRLTATLRGRGTTPGLAPGNLRYHAERLYIKPPRTAPPTDVAARLRFPDGIFHRPTPTQGATALRADEDEVGDLTRELDPRAPATSPLASNTTTRYAPPSHLPPTPRTPRMANGIRLVS